MKMIACIKIIKLKMEINRIKVMRNLKKALRKIKDFIT